MGYVQQEAAEQCHIVHGNLLFRLDSNPVNHFWRLHTGAGGVECFEDSFFCRPERCQFSFGPHQHPVTEMEWWIG